MVPGNGICANVDPKTVARMHKRAGQRVHIPL